MEYDINGCISADGAAFYTVLSPVKIAILDASIQPDHLYLCRVNVPQEYRGQGVGSALMDEFKRAAKKAGHTQIIVEPGGYQSADQDRRIRWYEKHGFVKQAQGHYLLDLTKI